MIQFIVQKEYLQKKLYINFNKMGYLVKESKHNFTNCQIRKQPELLFMARMA